MPANCAAAGAIPDLGHLERTTVPHTNSDKKSNAGNTILCRTSSTFSTLSSLVVTFNLDVKRV
jgi:hypothetical protein